MKHTILIGWLLLSTTLIVVPDIALASTSGTLTSICNFLLRIWDWAQDISYLMIAIGIAIIGIKAGMGGKFVFGNLAALGGAAFLVAMAPLLLAFLTGGVGTLSCTLANPNYQPPGIGTQ